MKIHTGLAALTVSFGLIWAHPAQAGVYDPYSTEDMSPEERQAKREERLKAFVATGGRRNDCAVVSEIMANPSPHTAVGMPETVHSQLIVRLRTSPTGEQLVQSAVRSDALICVHNDIQPSGYYDSGMNVIAYKMADSCLFRHGGYGSWKPEEFEANVRFTVAEEFAHHYQYKTELLLESIEKKTHHIHSTLLLQLAVEAQAKVIALKTLMEEGAQGNTGILTTFLGQGLTESSMGQAMMPVYLRLGMEEVDADPSELVMAYNNFFKFRESLEYYVPYYGRGLTQSFEAVTEPPQWIDSKLYGRFFGSLPGLPSGFLDEGERIVERDLIDLMPDSPIRTWFREAHSAVWNNTEVPPLPAIAETELDRCYQRVLEQKLTP